MEKAVYVKGLFGKEKSPKAPEFVICKLTAKKDELIAWLGEQEGEWVNMDVVKGREAGKLSVKLDTWKPDGSFKKSTTSTSQADIDYDAMGTKEIVNDDGSTMIYPDDMNPDEIPF